MITDDTARRTELAKNIRRLLDSKVVIISTANAPHSPLTAEVEGVVFHVSSTPRSERRISDSAFRHSNLIRQLEPKMRKDGESLRGVIEIGDIEDQAVTHCFE